MTLTKEPTIKEILKFSLPITISFLVTSSMTLIDTYFVSKLGSNQLAAVPTSSLFYIVFWITANGLIRSVIAFLGNEFVTSNYRNIVNIAEHFQLLVLLTFPLFYILKLLWPIYSYLSGLEPAVEKFGQEYINIRIYESIFSLTFCLFSYILQTSGNSRIPMLIAMCILLINSLLDYLLIFGNFGFPKLEVEGSAIATVIAQAIGAIAIVIYVKKFSPLRLFSFKSVVFRSHKKISTYMPVATPQAISDFVEIFTWIIFVFIIANLGTHSLAASNININVNLFSFLPITAMGVAVATYSSKLIHLNKQATKNSINKCLCITAIYSLVIGVIFWFYGHNISSFFTTDHDIKYLAATNFKIIAISQFFGVFYILLKYSVNAIKDTYIPMIIVFTTTILILYPLSFILIKIVGPPVLGAWIAMLIYTLVLAVSFIFRFKILISK